MSRRSSLAILLISTIDCGLLVDSSGLVGAPSDAAVRLDSTAPDGDASPGVDAAADEDATSFDARAEDVVDAASDASLDADAPRDVAVPDGALVWNVNGHAYLVVVHDGGVSWATAKQEAIALGGHLATIESFAENAFVSQVANANEAAWDGIGGPFLGGFQPPGSSEPDGGWSWVTGEPWSFTAWAPAEPSGGLVEDHVQLEARFSAAWNDIASGAPNAFIVEFE